MRKSLAAILAVLFCFVLFANGCAWRTNQLGETAAEGHRRHLRNARINQQELMGDIDRFLLFREPSKLTPMRIP